MMSTIIMFHRWKNTCFPLGKYLHYR